MVADRIADANWLLSFHGSEISRAWLSEGSDGQDLHITFSAAAATQADGTEGFLSGLTLVVSYAQGELAANEHGNTPTHASANPSLSERDLGLLLGGIAEGHVAVSGKLLRQMPVPGLPTGPLSLSLRLISETSLSASGHSLHFELAQSATFRESWAC